MKKTMFQILTISCFSTLFCISCSFLDHDESIGQDADFVFSYFDEARKTVSNIYSYLPNDFGTIDGALRESATDNAVHVHSGSSVRGFYDGRWSASNPIDNVWPTYYAAIRSANYFLETFSIDNFEKFAANDDYKQQIQIASIYPYEVRFLRAFFYFELVKRYRNIPIVTTVLDKNEVNGLKQSDFEDVIDFIVEECDECAANLPVSYIALPSAETGRATKGAAMALKSRATLYAASPLFNGGVSVAEKYRRAVDAAWDLISLAKETNLYSITSGEVLWGNGNTMFSSRQLILERRNPATNTFEQRNTPIGFEGGNTGTCPTQNFVDAFERSNGAVFNWDNATMAANPYSNRDARLEQTVIHNGSTWKNIAVETYFGGRNAQPLANATLTGYYLKKFMDETISLKAGNMTTKPHHYILFRYAEILLNYAEAMTEWKGHSYSDARYTLTPIQAVNEVRGRSSAAKINANITKDNFIAKYRNERRVELAFEDHRFWDIRRWKIGPSTADIYGIRITKRANGTYAYERYLVEERLWEDRMYLYPIPQGECLKNRNLVQNPGW